MVLQLIETADSLLLRYPAWLPLVCGLLGAACGYTAIWRPAQWKDRRWAGFVVTGLLLFAALYFGSYRARFDQTGGRQGSIVGYRVQVDWREVSSVRLERSRGKGAIGQVIVVATPRGEFEFNTADLDAHSLGRVRQYIEARIDASR